MDITRTPLFSWIVFSLAGLGVGWAYTRLGPGPVGGVLVGVVVLIAAFKLKETSFPLVLLLTLALGSAYRGDVSEKSYYLRFFLLVLIAIRGASLILNSKKLGGEENQHPPSPVHWGFFLTGLMGLVCSIRSVDSGIASQRAISFLLLFFVVFVYFWWRNSTVEQCEKYTIALWWGVTLILGIGYAFFVLRVPGMWRAGRLRLVLGNPNQLGHYCALMAPISVWFLFEKAGPKRRLLAWGSLGALFLSLILTGSRGGLIAATLGVGVQFLLCYRKRLVFMALVLGLIGSIHYFMGESVPKPGEDPTFFEETILRKNTLESGSGRTGVWEAARGLIAKRPIFGYGFGTADRLFQLGYFPMIVEFQGGHVHNSYLEELLNLGWLGAMPLFLCLAYLLVMGAVILFYRHTLTPNYRLAVALYGVVLAGMASGVVESWFTSVGSVFCFPYWLSVALFLKTVRHFSDWRPA